jgi:hypothetical protein
MKSVFQPTAMLLPGVFRATGTYAEKPPAPRFDVRGFTQAATLAIITIGGMENVS